MQIFQKLNAPYSYLDTISGVELWLKREDLIHPELSGNKWRKLKYYLEDFRKSGKSVILTFGGAFSNHLAATAALGKIAGIPTKALVRGEEVQHNPTLDFCRAQGMELEAISRKRYATKDDPAFMRLLEETLPGVYAIPEGGKGPLGVKGCTEILEAVPEDFDYIAVAAGTGTTSSGLLLSVHKAQVLCFPALKGGRFLHQAIHRQLLDFQQHFPTVFDEQKLLNTRLRLVEKYHFGGYGKVSSALIDFMNGFYEQYRIPLDPVYTGKLLYGLFDMIKTGEIAKGSKVLAIHTGGLQGIKGMNARLHKQGLKINYEV